MRWIKRGLVFAPDGTRWWARKYASFPTVDVLGDVLRVYFAALDDRNYGRVGYIDLDARNPARILYEAPEPVLDLGEIGTFDDCGVNPFSIVTHNERKYLYYQGWQRAERIPYLIFTGLAIGDLSVTHFTKYSRKPILDRVEDDLFLRGAPWVLKDHSEFRMWYVSCRHWVQDEHGLHYDVAIRHATSSDGIHWKADTVPCLAPASKDEYAIGRPSVIFDGNRYRMWYSIRSFSQPYRIGYAESEDGIRWIRDDSQAPLEKSEAGWDSQMACYPCVVMACGKMLMFYNGNQHGSTGFGYAVAE